VLWGASGLRVIEGGRRGCRESCACLLTCVERDPSTVSERSTLSIKGTMTTKSHGVRPKGRKEKGRGGERAATGQEFLRGFADKLMGTFGAHKHEERRKRQREWNKREKKLLDGRALRYEWRRARKSCRVCCRRERKFLRSSIRSGIKAEVVCGVNIGKNAHPVIRVLGLNSRQCRLENEQERVLWRLTLSPCNG
jgi:hypothetical protein